MNRFELVNTLPGVQWPRMPKALVPKRWYLSIEAARRAAVLIACHFARKGMSGPQYRVRQVRP